MAAQLLAVPNVSEGRDPLRIGALQSAFARGVTLLDRHSDADHDRSVFTLAGEPALLREALVVGAEQAIETIDMGDYEGLHPAVGALDVCPLVWLDPPGKDAGRREAVELAEQLGGLGVPVFLYGELATRPLHFIWIADCSGSMAVDGKIQSLNTAIKEAIPSMQDVADENPNAQVLVRAVRFSDGAQWHVSQPTDIADFKWEDLTAGGVTAMGRALSIVADQLKIPPMTDRALPPVLVLISDGQPTDDFTGGLQALMNEPWGRKAVRIAIAIGEDADQEVLKRFINNPELRPLQANNPEALTKYIRWVSTAVLKSASSPMSRTTDFSTGLNIPLPVIPDTGAADDVW